MIDCTTLARGVALVVILALADHVSPVHSFGHSPDCSAILSKATFFSYDIVCNFITKKWENDEIPVLPEGENKWDVIETCTCNLLSHELAWASMLTHESDALYLTIYKYIDTFDKETAEKKKADNVKSSEEDIDRQDLMFQGAEGERMYYWDRLDDILSNQCKDDQDFDELTLKLMSTFSKIYYDPDTFTHRFARQSRGQSLRKVLSKTCNSMLDNFWGYMAYFDKLRQFAQNDRLLFKLTAYSEHLHKIRMIMKLCSSLEQSGQLISNN